MTINSSLNRSGGAGNDTLSGSAANNAFDGKAGTDTVLYSGARAGYTVLASTNGFTVGGADGFDSMVDQALQLVKEACFGQQGDRQKQGKKKIVFSVFVFGLAQRQTPHSRNIDNTQQGDEKTSKGRQK